MERESNAYVQHEISTGLVLDSALQNNMVDQPARLGLLDVVVGGLVDNITRPVCNNLGREGGQAVIEVSTRLVPDSALQNNVVDQPAGLDSVDVVAGRLVDEISGPVRKNLKTDEGQAVTTF